MDELPISNFRLNGLCFVVISIALVLHVDVQSLLHPINNITNISLSNRTIVFSGDFLVVTNVVSKHGQEEGQ